MTDVIFGDPTDSEILRSNLILEASLSVGMLIKSAIEVAIPEHNKRGKRQNQDENEGTFETNVGSHVPRDMTTTSLGPRRLR
jgi:hypothetical protein